jgi:hypothetical protein
VGRSNVDSPVDIVVVSASGRCDAATFVSFLRNELVANLVAYPGGRSSRNLITTLPFDAPKVCNAVKSRDCTFEFAIK